jgi:hypothetical protein
MIHFAGTMVITLLSPLHRVQGLILIRDNDVWRWYNIYIGRYVQCRCIMVIQYPRREKIEWGNSEQPRTAFIVGTSR